MKKGIQTSEFWVVLSAIGGVLFTFAQNNCDLSTDKLVALALALLGAVYAGGRTYLKVKSIK